ncbi:hypothetical protein BLNAU_18595 [Blattamonas nauphoetae]|uniref:Uncharacterized protein n=1 Tax=Blattamonas nauphoetae TaxID=2049346 RepID=A0ABQ9X3Z2_9EUKA|nr:hypothetical protein BLNAU_18595 [Blattamonas nauphoetae]
MWCGEADFPCQSVNEADKHLKHALPSTIEVQTSAVLHSELDLTHDITKITSGSGEKGRVDVSKEGCLVNQVDTPTHSDSVLLHRPYAVPRLLPESTPSPMPSQLELQRIASQVGFISTANMPNQSYIDAITFLLTVPNQQYAHLVLSVLSRVLDGASMTLKNELIQASMIQKFLDTVNPVDLPIPSNEDIHSSLIWIISKPLLVRSDAPPEYRQNVFTDLILPSSLYLRFPVHVWIALPI